MAARRSDSGSRSTTSCGSGRSERSARHSAASTSGCTDSTNARARELAARGRPHGTLVTAARAVRRPRPPGAHLDARRPGRALLCSLRDPRPAAAAAARRGRGGRRGRAAPSAVKWPNDVLIDGRKVAGILVEGRPQERWAVLGIGLNVALRIEDFPPELRGPPGRWASSPRRSSRRWSGCWSRSSVAGRRRRRRAGGRARARRSAGSARRWARRRGRGAGIDGAGGCSSQTDGGPVALEAGEVHLQRMSRGA